MSDVIEIKCECGDAPQIVKHTHYSNGTLVSTVSLLFGYEYPFETMVYRDDKWEYYQKRYATEVEALVGHEVTVARVNTGEVLK